jgi:hypothetical protein
LRTPKATHSIKPENTLKLSKNQLFQKMELKSIFHNLGRIAKSLEMNPGAGSSEINLPINVLKSGIYHVRVKGNNLNYSQKIIKK